MFNNNANILIAIGSLIPSIKNATIGDSSSQISDKTVGTPKDFLL